MVVIPQDSFLNRIPLLKLPPAWLEPALEALSKSDGSRSVSVQKILEAFPGHDEKLAVRAFVVPTLTRTHFVRASPGRLALAPNGLLWTESPPDLRGSFVGLCLRDLLVHRLRLSERDADPTRITREASKYGKLGRDRCGGMTRLLRRFPPPMPRGTGEAVVIETRTGQPARLTLTEFRKSLRSVLKEMAFEAPVLGLDVLRIDTLRRLREQGHLASSLAVDRALLSVMSEGELFVPFGSATNHLDALVLGRRPFLAVRPLVAA